MFKKSVEPIDGILLSRSKRILSSVFGRVSKQKICNKLMLRAQILVEILKCVGSFYLLGPKVIYIFPNSCFCFVTQMNAVSLRYCHTKFKVFVCFVFLRCSFEQCLNQVETFPLAVIQSVQSLYPYMRCNDYSLHLELTSFTM